MLDVALEAGLSPETLRKIETGRIATPSFPTIAAIAGVLGLSLDEVWAEASAADNGLTREFHIVGGLDMHAGLDYYAEMFRGLKARHPHVHIKALTAVEIAHLARIEKMSWTDVLVALREAGLDTLPGGGAETFSAAVRRNARSSGVANPISRM